MTPTRWRLLFWAALIFAFVMAVVPHPPRLPGDPGDKIQHIVAFATLSLLGHFAFREVPALRLVVGLALFGALIEMVQTIPALNRDGDIVDWIADTLAVIAVLGLLRLVRKR